MSKRILFATLIVCYLLLSLVFIWNYLDTHWMIQLTLSALIGISLGIVCLRKLSQDKSAVHVNLTSLPVSQRVVLVMGDDLSNWIEAGQAWRLFRDTMWVRVEHYSALISTYQELENQNRAPCGIFLIVNPDSYEHVGALEQRISHWRQEIETVQGLYKRALPITLGLYTSLGDNSLHTWPSELTNLSCRVRQDASVFFAQLQHLQDSRSGLEADHPAYISHSVASSLYLSQEWTLQFIIKNLLPEKVYHHSVLINAYVWMNSFKIDEKADWRQFEAQKTGLVSPGFSHHMQGLKDFPKVELNWVVPRQLPLFTRYLFHFMNAFLIFTIVGLTYSFTHNKQWLQEVNATHRQYLSLPIEKETDRLAAINELKELQQKLHDYEAYGAPSKMGFGLYKATTLLPLINDDINSFKLAVKDKQVIRLDTTALFDVGQSQLKPNAKLVMQGVLTWIQANPNKRVLIDGHTDNTGNAEANKRLSFERATAVRTWLLMASTFPESHFTVQGFGDTQPISENDSAEGRAKNRRVEITLVDTSSMD